MKNMINKAKQGFTIVELVIVIAVIGILAGVLIPTFSNVISSANEAANLQEAENSLKAYTAYVSSRGEELNDGAVFNVKDTYYVFFEGSLHKFKYEETTEIATVAKPGPKLAIETTEYACNRRFQLEENGAAVTVGDKPVWFYFYDKTEVVFEDGSKKTKIYAGRMIAQKDNYDTATNPNDTPTDQELYINVEVQVENTVTVGTIFTVTLDSGKQELKLGHNCISKTDVWEKIGTDTTFSVKGNDDTKEYVLSENGKDATKGIIKLKAKPASTGE